MTQKSTDPKPLSAARDIPPELMTPNYRTGEVTGIGHDPNWVRQDPSNVIKVDDTYYVYVTRYPPGTNTYAASITYAASTDGWHWEERGVAIRKGGKGAWDSFGVLTPYVMALENQYYLYYTATYADEPWKLRGTKRHIGVAIADSPDGPWVKYKGNPVLSPGAPGDWDSLLVDDTHVIVRDGKYWLYYKGGTPQVTPETTKWGLAIGDRPTGPFIKHANKPVFGSGHTVCVWPHREGVAALVDAAGPERHTIQYAPDGMHFRRAVKLDYVDVGCGPYDPDAFTDTDYGRGITWGVVAGRREEQHYGIIRFDVDLQAPPRS